jgi:hypothetical protein
MPTPLELLAARLLYKALDCKIGLVVTTSDPVKAKAIFYRFRREIGDPLLMNLKIYISPTNPTSELWILKDPRAEPPS